MRSISRKSKTVGGGVVAVGDIAERTLAALKAAYFYRALNAVCPPQQL